MLDANSVVFHERIMVIKVLNSNLIHEVFTVKVYQHYIKCTHAKKLSNHKHYSITCLLKKRRISTWDWPESPHPGILCRVWQQTGHDDLKVGLGHLIQPVTDILEYRIPIYIYMYKYVLTLGQSLCSSYNFPSHWLYSFNLLHSSVSPKHFQHCLKIR